MIMRIIKHAKDKKYEEIENDLNDGINQIENLKEKNENERKN